MVSVGPVLFVILLIAVASFSTEHPSRKSRIPMAEAPFSSTERGRGCPSQAPIRSASSRRRKPYSLPPYPSLSTLASDSSPKQPYLLCQSLFEIDRCPAAVRFISFRLIFFGIKSVMGSKTKNFIVLEFATGGELLDKIINHDRMRENETRKYFQQLINAVDYCHSRGVYHRDLKPENLLLDAYGNLKVSDFGLSALSQQVRGDGLLHTACGTPNYVAPEVLNDRGYDGATADLWSCGVILFVLLAGYLPFEDSNLITLYNKISAAEFTCPTWFSLEAKTLLTRILDPNPMTRITVSEILKNEWFKKDYKPPVFEETYEANLDDVHAVFMDSEEHHVKEKEEQPTMMNAFELISTSKGLDLGNLFDVEQEFKRETRFTSTCPANEIISKIEEAAKPLGFDVQKKNYKMKLENAKAGRKGNLKVATEVFQVAPSLHMVEVRKAKGDTLEFHKFYKNLSNSLKEVVWISEEATQQQEQDA